MMPPTPGEVLRDRLSQLAPMGRVTQDRLADAMGVSRYSINQLLNDKRNLTAEMAVRLGRATNTSAEFWLRLQMNADLARARHKLGNKLNSIEPLVPPMTEEEMFYDVQEE